MTAPFPRTLQLVSGPRSRRVGRPLLHGLSMVDALEARTLLSSASPRVSKASTPTKLAALNSAGGDATTIVVSNPVNASKSTDNESELDIAVNPNNPLQVFAVANSGDAEGLRASYSTDGGATFTNRFMDGSSPDAVLPTFCDARVAFDSFGNLYMTYLTTGNNNVLSLVRSTNGGQSFTNVQSWSGSWDNPSITIGFNNQIWIQATNTISDTQQAIGLQSTGPGASGAAVGPNTVFAGGGFGDIAVGIDGSIVFTSLDSTDGQGPVSIPVYRDPDGLGPAGFSLMKTFSSNVGGFDYIPAQNSRSIDAEANFAVIPAGKLHAGRIFLTYTDEPVNESNDTNVMLAHSDDNGLTWSSPVKVNDDTTTRSQFLQSIAVDASSGAVGLSWYDSRNDAGVAGNGSTNSVANDDAQFYGAFSIDGGDTFLPNVQISAGVNNAPSVKNPNDYGDWTGADFANGYFFAAWADNSTALTPTNTSRPLLEMAVGKVAVNAAPITGVTGNVWNDDDVDGVFDTGETGVGNVSVFIDANNNGMLDSGEITTVTNSTGGYTLIGLAAGTYVLGIVLPAGSRPTSPTTQSVTVAAGQGINSVNFGLTTAVSLSGVAFDDLDADGVRDAGEPGIAGARVYLDANNNGVYEGGTQSYASANVPLTISATSASTLNSTLAVPATVGTVTKVTVTVNITHTFDGDLTLTLIAPDGTRVVLSKQAGGSANNYKITTFDDAASKAITAGAPPFNGTYRPLSPLGALIGHAGAGTWKLEVNDAVAQDGGTLTAWSIALGSVETSVVTDASGHYAFPPLPAGTYRVRQVLSPGYTFTNPTAGVYVLNAASGSVVTADFASRDADRPLQTGGQFNVDGLPPSVTIAFSEDVTLTPALITLTNLTTGSVVPADLLLVAFDSATHSAAVTFPGFANGVLPDGNYRLSIASTVADAGGKTVSNPASIDFFVLAGDANRDHVVDFKDLVILAQHYGSTGNAFTQGNVDSSPDGAVTFGDLVILAQHYNVGLPSAASLIAPTPAATTTTKSRRSAAAGII